MGMREKLIELIEQAEEQADKRCDFAENCDQCPADNQGIDCLDWLKADCLIANGVTIQKWIPVTERLPEQGQEVIVFSGGVVKGSVFAYHFWNKDFQSWQHITHWMPMPEPPSGERRTDDERTG